MPTQSEYITKLVSILWKLADKSADIPPTDVMTFTLEAMSIYIHLHQVRIVLTPENRQNLRDYRATMEGIVRYNLLLQNYQDLTHASVIKILELLGNQYEEQIVRLTKFKDIITVDPLTVFTFRMKLFELVRNDLDHLLSGYGNSKSEMVLRVNELYGVDIAH